MNSKLVRRIVWFLCIVITLQIAYAQVETLGTFKKDSIITLSQTCDNCTFINVTKIKYPNSSETYPNTGMSQPVQGNFNSTLSETSALGEYIVTTCGNPNGYYNCESYNFYVTDTGEEFSLDQSLIIFGQFGIAALFLIIGLTFTKEKWKIKTFFFLMALIMGVIFLNSARVVASSSTSLTTMGNYGLITVMIVLIVMFLYAFIYYTIEVFQYVKKKSDSKWTLGNKAY